MDRDLEKYKLRLLVQVTPPTTSYAHYKLRLRLAGRRQTLLPPGATVPETARKWLQYLTLYNI